MEVSTNDLPATIDVTRSGGTTTTTDEKKDTKGRTSHQYNSERKESSPSKGPTEKTGQSKHTQQRTQLARSAKARGHARSVPLLAKETEQEQQQTQGQGELGEDNSSRDASPIPEDDEGLFRDEVSFPGISSSSSALRLNIDTALQGSVDHQKSDEDSADRIAEILEEKSLFFGLADATITAQQQRSRFVFDLRGAVERTIAFVNTRKHECFCPWNSSGQASSATFPPERNCYRAQLVTEGYAKRIAPGGERGDFGPPGFSNELLQPITTLRCGAQISLQGELEYFVRELALLLQPFPKWERIGDPEYPYGREAQRALQAFAQHETNTADASGNRGLFQPGPREPANSGQTRANLRYAEGYTSYSHQ